MLILFRVLFVWSESIQPILIQRIDCPTDKIRTGNCVFKLLCQLWSLRSFLFKIVCGSIYERRIKVSTSSPYFKILMTSRLLCHSWSSSLVICLMKLHLFLLHLHYEILLLLQYLLLVVVVILLLSYLFHYLVYF